MVGSVKKAYDARGIDWLSVVIPPLNEDEGEYTLRFHMTFLMSNWSCIFANGCPGMFGVQSSTIQDDAGCCVHSFYFETPEEIPEVQARMEQLTDADWDKDLRAHVERHGFVRMFTEGDEEGNGFKAKGRVVDGACVFQNRNGGSSGHTGCAFHWLGQRTGESHVETMPAVCWQLPLRMNDLGKDVYEIVPWDVAEWSDIAPEFEPRRYATSWWCIDTPEAYQGTNPVYKNMEEELRAMLGHREYELFVDAVEQRVAAGFKYGPMPGAILNDGRSLLPLYVGNREPRRQPSYYPAFLANIKDNQDEPAGTDS